jgi:predicted molibdopterin-dependent oxidoreductase YjgC
MSNRVGMAVTEMIPGILEGKIQALYILGEDPVVSDPDSNHARQCLEQCNFVVLQEAAYSGWDYGNTAQVMDELAALTPSYAGISHDRLERGKQLLWPVANETHPGTPILHVGQFARGRGKFTGIDHVPPVELPDDEYPMLMTTGRVLYHWHGSELTRRARGLLNIYHQPLVEINPDDAQRLHISASPRDTGSLPGAGDQRVRVTSRRGSIEALAWVTDRVPAGILYANFHFPEASANILTIAALDPVAKIPEYKVRAVRVETM